MHLKLRGKFLLPTIILVVVGMAVMGYTSYHFAADSLIASVENEIEQRSIDMATLISTWLTERKREVEIWSENKTYIDALQEGFVGQVARKQSIKDLTDLKAKYDFLESLSLADKKGNVISSSEEKAIGIQVADRPYFTEAITGNPSISPVLVSKLTGNPIFILAAAIKRQDVVEGIIFVVIDLGMFNRDFIDSLKIGQNGYAYMYDRDGRVIAYPPDKTQILKLNIGDYEFGQKMMAQRNGIITYTFNGQQRIAAFRHNEDTGWTVGLAALTDEVYAPAKRIGFINLILTMVVVVVIGLAMLFLVSRVVTKPLARVVGVIRKISRGNLQERVDIKSHDELGQLSSALDGFIVNLADFTDSLHKIEQGDLTGDIPLLSEEDQIGPAAQAMLDNLRDIVGRVDRSSTRIANGSTQVSDSSQSLSQGATEQAASLEEITSSMTELGGQTTTNAENALQANQLAKDARDAALKGNQQMDGMIGAMKDISDSSREIAKIIKAIDDIAFQTNLLALNAAVEAARAGKHGKGFAVVAQEVRNLAGRSAKAAQETAELIDGAVKKVANGTEILNRTASALAEIMEGSTKVTDLVGEIAAASNEQAQGISQVNQGLSQVEQVTQQNTANAEETASAAVELSSQAAEMRQILTRFSLKEQQELHPTQRLAAEPLPRTVIHDADGESLPWGDVKNDTKNHRIRPEQLIALDDEDFGKY